MFVKQRDTQYLYQVSWTSWCDAMLPKSHCDLLPLLVGGTTTTTTIIILIHLGGLANIHTKRYSLCQMSEVFLLTNSRSRFLAIFPCKNNMVTEPWLAGSADSTSGLADAGRLSAGPSSWMTGWAEGKHLWSLIGSSPGEVLGEVKCSSGEVLSVERLKAGWGRNVAISYEPTASQLATQCLLFIFSEQCAYLIRNEWPLSLWPSYSLLLFLLSFTLLVFFSSQLSCLFCREEKQSILSLSSSSVKALFKKLNIKSCECSFMCIL